MTTDHELADELVKLATLLRMGLKPEVPPLVRYLLHACHAEIENARPNEPEPASGKYTNRTYRHPMAILMDLRPSENYRRARKAQYHFDDQRRHFDPEYDFTLRIHDHSQRAAHLCPEFRPETNFHTPSKSPWKNNFL